MSRFYEDGRWRDYIDLYDLHHNPQRIVEKSRWDDESTKRFLLELCKDEESADKLSSALQATAVSNKHVMNRVYEKEKELDDLIKFCYSKFGNKNPIEVLKGFLLLEENK